MTADGSVEIEAEGFLISDGCLGFVRGEEMDPWGRSDTPTPLAGRDWVILGPARAYFTTTEGGAAITNQCQVLNDQQQPISGLYAVGQVGLGGQILFGHGLHIAWALTSGRLVGRAICALAKGNQDSRQQ